jgi:hypothetical protein
VFDEPVDASTLELGALTLWQWNVSTSLTLSPNASAITSANGTDQVLSPTATDAQLLYAAPSHLVCIVSAH